MSSACVYHVTDQTVYEWPPHLHDPCGHCTKAPAYPGHDGAQNRELQHRQRNPRDYSLDHMNIGSEGHS